MSARVGIDQSETEIGRGKGIEREITITVSVKRESLQDVMVTLVISIQTETGVIVVTTILLGDTAQAQQLPMLIMGERKESASKSFHGKHTQEQRG